MAQRRFVRSIAEPLLEGQHYSVTMIGRPLHRSAIAAAIREGCGTLVVSTTDARRGRRDLFQGAGQAGLKIIVVSTEWN